MLCIDHCGWSQQLKIGLRNAIAFSKSRVAPTNKPQTGPCALQTRAKIMELVLSCP